MKSDTTRGHDFHIGKFILEPFKCWRARSFNLQGKVLFYFPNQQKRKNQRARALISEGVLEGIDAIIGFHNKPELPVGTISEEATTYGSSRSVQSRTWVRQHHTERPNRGCLLRLRTLKPSLLVTSPPEPVVPRVSPSKQEIHGMWSERKYFWRNACTLIKKSNANDRDSSRRWLSKLQIFTDKKEVLNGFLTPPVVHNDVSIAKSKVWREICDSGDTEAL